jgi:hypothetical protein
MTLHRDKIYHEAQSRFKLQISLPSSVQARFRNSIVLFPVYTGILIATVAHLHSELKSKVVMNVKVAKERFSNTVQSSIFDIVSISTQEASST